MATLSSEGISLVLGQKNCFIPLVLLGFFLPKLVAQAQSSAELKVTVEPASPLIEHRDGKQLTPRLPAEWESTEFCSGLP